MRVVLLGASCTKLQGCCDALTKAGITGSAKPCVSVVDGRNEFGCDAAFKAFSAPDDFYDPPTACE